MKFMKKKTFIFSGLIISLLVCVCLITAGFTVFGIYRIVYKKQQPIIIKTDASILYYEKYFDNSKNEVSYGFNYWDINENDVMVQKSENIRNDLYIIEDGYILATDFYQTYYDVYLGGAKINYVAESMVIDPYINLIIKNKLPVKLQGYSLQDAQNTGAVTTPKPLTVTLKDGDNSINVLENFYLLPFFANGIFYDSSASKASIKPQTVFEVRSPRQLNNVSNTENIGVTGLTYKQTANNIFCGKDLNDKRTYLIDGQAYNNLAYCSNFGTVFISGTFKGIYEGNNKVIQNVSLVADVYGSGALFSGNSGTIQNLEVKNISVKSKTWTGGIVSTNNAGAVISNCKVSVSNGEYSTISSGVADYTGAIAAANYGKISNCSIVNNSVADDSTKGKINVLGGRFVGGLVGHNGGTIENCKIESSVSDGVLVSGTETVGGIAGFNEYGTFNGNTLNASGDINKGNITVEGSGYYIGGLIGSNYSNAVTTSNRAFTGKGKVLVKGITSTGDLGSSIGGYFGKNNTIITVDCSSAPITYNMDVSGKNNVGGFIGFFYQDGTGTGSLTFMPNGGGIAQITGNTTISGNENVGGVIGQCATSIITYNPTKVQFDGNININGVNDAGGAFGLVTAGVEIFNFNLGSVAANISINSNGNAGGYIGSNNGTISGAAGCQIQGNISVTGGNNVGGVIGYNNNVLGGSEFIASGKFTIKGNKLVGGIVGANSNSGFVKRISFKPTAGSLVEALATDDGQCGGIVGYNIGVIGGSLIESCTLKGSLNIVGAQQIGGIAGLNSGFIYSAIVEGDSSSSQINISITQNTASPYGYVGGIAGVNFGQIGTQNQSGSCAVIANTTITSGNRTNIGGIAGSNGGWVLNSTVGSSGNYTVHINAGSVWIDVSTLLASNNSGRVGVVGSTTQGFVGYAKFTAENSVIIANPNQTYSLANQ